MNLAAQAWLNDAKTRTLLAAFGDVPLRFVGGCVRDAVMGRNVGDIDCATPAKPEEVVALLEAADIKAVPTGLAHGTITAVIDSKPFEITTLRKDVACDGRHAEVEYTDDWQQDALRRDFTMNALYCDAHGEVFDYTDGVDAARAGRIQFIGDAEARIREDGLRILRFFRFFATHGLGAPDTTALKACAAHKAMLADLSGERIQQEMLKLCAAESPYAALEAMQQGDVLAALLPQATLGHHSAHPHPLLRLALMLPDAQAAGAVAERWRLSKHDRDLLLLLVEHPYADWPQPDEAIIRVARKLAPETYRLLLWRNGTKLKIENAMIKQKIAQYEALEMPVFPVTGGDLIAAGMPSGRELGARLRALEEKWEQSEYQMTKEELLEKT